MIKSLKGFVYFVNIHAYANGSSQTKKNGELFQEREEEDEGK
jgi:hypothetical protein